MPRPKSILPRVVVEEARKAHNCQHNKNHRLERGDQRLKIWERRSPDNYCVACGLEIIERDIAKLQEIAAKLRCET